MMSLYKIADQYQFLLHELYDDETGAVNETALSKLDELTEPLEQKCINITRVFKQIEAEREAIDHERKAMAAREKALNGQVTRLKEYLKYNMERCQINEIKCPQFVIKLAKNPASVDVYNKEEIPAEYTKVSIDYDIARMREDMMKKGVVIPGARLVQNLSIRIK